MMRRPAAIMMQVTVSDDSESEPGPGAPGGLVARGRPRRGCSHSGPRGLNRASLSAAAAAGGAMVAPRSGSRPWRLAPGPGPGASFNFLPARAWLLGSQSGPARPRALRDRDRDCGTGGRCRRRYATLRLAPFELPAADEPPPPFCFNGPRSHGRRTSAEGYLWARRCRFMSKSLDG
jgi:hypothetical protein